MASLENELAIVALPDYISQPSHREVRVAKSAGASGADDEIKKAADDAVKALDDIKDQVDDALKDAQDLKKSPDPKDAKKLGEDVKKIIAAVRKLESVTKDLKG